MPVIFDLTDSLPAEDSVRFELTYVQMLNYNFGSVTINLKNDYSLIQTAPLAYQTLNINISSSKTILDFEILMLQPPSLFFAHETGSYAVFNQPRCTYKRAPAFTSDSLPVG